MEKDLAKHLQQRSLVSIRREGIDAHAIQAFVLDYSDDLVALQYVFDFNLDGLMFLRVQDITAVKCSATCRFQNGLLEQEGLLDSVPFGASFELESWGGLINQLARQNSILILEREYESARTLFIGNILKVTRSGVLGHYFSGAANWAKRPERLKFKDITCCQVGTNYIKFYQRHFERAAGASPGSSRALVARSGAPATAAKTGPSG